MRAKITTENIYCSNITWQNNLGTNENVSERLGVSRKLGERIEFLGELPLLIYFFLIWYKTTFKLEFWESDVSPALSAKHLIWKKQNKQTNKNKNNKKKQQCDISFCKLPMKSMYMQKLLSGNQYQH